MSTTYHDTYTHASILYESGAYIIEAELFDPILQCKMSLTAVSGTLLEDVTTLYIEMNLSVVRW